MAIPTLVLLIAAAVQPPVVLACNIPPLGAVAVSASDVVPQRLFRIGPGLLQEWDAGRKAFGANRCAAFTCMKAVDRAEGTISSASVVYAVGLSGGMGYWRVIGASGKGLRAGSCRVVTSPAPAP